ncbi:MAG: hypothetical protein KKA70_15865 [Proteobacteria bacterium]|nr:hypothetical protein [Pseudomonadota bacterium]
MFDLNQVKTNRDLVNKIDWSMTPEKAIDMYLEWGAGWTRGNDFVSSDTDESIYFVIFDWEDPPQVTLLRRNMKEVEEIAKIEVPRDLFHKALLEDGSCPGVGVHRLNKELNDWVCRKLDAHSLDYFS